MKRIFDILASLLGLLVLAPFFLLVGLWIKAGSSGPVFFRQTRIGRDQKPFTILKFRTMTVGHGPEITVGADSRITPAGESLRRFKIDELPQLLNVFKGEMSLVGPRPEVPKYVSHYSDEEKQVFNYRPGITDPASLKYRNESELLAMQEDPEAFYISTVLPDKLKINLDYARRASLITDLGVIFATLKPQVPKD